MEKIIYNSKLKKLFIALLLFMVLFSFVCPNIAYAIKFNGYTATGSIQEIATFLCTDGGKIKEWMKSAQPTNALEKTVKEKIKSELTLNDPEKDSDKIYRDYKDQEEKIQVMCSCAAVGTAMARLSYSVTINLTTEDVEKTLAKSDDEIEDVKTNIIGTPPESSAAGQNPNYDGIDEDEEQTDVADGGILLEPLFALVNFVADSFTDILGQLMLGNGEKGFEWTSNIEQFQPDNIKSLTPNDVYRLNTGSFVNLLGTHYYRINYSPEKIFSGEIELLSIDFISGKNAAGEEIDGDWASIRVVISQWYKVLRMIAIIGLLSVLIYTGIKIIISANAKDKAKYKEWIINWFVAVAILFCMHYIMSFVISVTNEISQLISSASGEIIVEAGKEFDDNTVNTNNVFATNLMGVVRFMVQADNGAKKIGYEVMYIALLFYTIKFTFIYLKRVLNMAFLTLIAPIVALTYPIDKINDGNAQGFNMWLKEYIFNALLQPMHLILYYILVGSAVSIAASNPLYAIVVLMFLTEAEKLLKKIFGFDKASGGTVGGMTGAFAAGAIASNIKNIAKLAGGKGSKGGNNGSETDNNLLDNMKPRRDKGVAEDFSDNLLDGGSSPVAEPEENDGSNVNHTENSSAAATGATPLTSTNSSTSVTGATPATATNSSTSVTGATPTTTATNSSASRTGAAARTGASASARASSSNGQNTSKGGIIGGLANVAAMPLRTIYDWKRDSEYNKKRWKRRGANALKGLGKAAVGTAFGITAAAVQAGISITDGKYSPMEGMATFAAGYAGGSGFAKSVGGTVSNAFKEGYYDGNNDALIEKRQEEFMYSDDVDAKYKKEYGNNADTMKNLAKDNLVPYGYTDPKEQKAIFKFATKLTGKSELTDASPEMQKAAIERARKTRAFMDELKAQGQYGVIGDLGKQEKYVQSILNSKGITEANNKAEYDRIRNNYDTAFKSIAQWQQVNRK